MTTEDICSSIRNEPYKRRIPVSKILLYEEPCCEETIEFYYYESKKGEKLNPVTVFVDAAIRHFKRIEGATKQELVAVVKSEIHLVECSSEKLYSILNKTLDDRLPKLLSGVGGVIRSWQVYDEPLLKEVFFEADNGYGVYIWQITA